MKSRWHVGVVRTVEFHDCIEVEAETEEEAIELALERFVQKDHQFDVIGTEAVDVEKLPDDAGPK